MPGERHVDRAAAADDSSVRQAIYAEAYEVCASWLQPSDLRSAAKHTLGARDLHQLFEPLRLRLHHTSPEVGQAIIATPLIVLVGVRSFRRHSNQPIRQQSLDGPIERSRDRKSTRLNSSHV